MQPQAFLSGWGPLGIQIAKSLVDGSRPRMDVMRRCETRMYFKTCPPNLLQGVGGLVQFFFHTQLEMSNDDILHPILALNIDCHCQQVAKYIAAPTPMPFPPFASIVDP